MKKIKLIVCLYAFFVTAIQAQQWETIPGQGRDIGVGYNGMVWHLGWASVPGGHPIYRRMGSDWERMDVGSGAVRLDVDAFGNAWCVNSNGLISRWDGSKWQSIGGQGRDIGIGVNGTVWLIGWDAVPGGYSIHRWTGSYWQQMPGGALVIDVDPQGNAWIANDQGYISKWNGTSWVTVTGQARDITIGATGVAWCVGWGDQPGGSFVYKWANNQWQQLNGGMQYISAGGNGEVWATNSGGALFRMNSSTLSPPVQVVKPNPKRFVPKGSTPNSSAYFQADFKTIRATVSKMGEYEEFGGLEESPLHLQIGSILFYKTSKDAFGKMQIMGFGMGKDTLAECYIRWTTYKPDGSGILKTKEYEDLYATFAGSRWHDLDGSQSTGFDFRWNIKNDLLFIEARKGAKFYLLPTDEMANSSAKVVENPVKESSSATKPPSPPKEVSTDNKPQRRLALVIGNSAYANTRDFLPNPVNDATDITTALREMGFEVITSTNATRQKMDAAIADFGTRLKNYNLGFFYYAGHGVQIDGENYLVPIDAALKSQGEVIYECYPVGRILAKMEDAAIQANVIVLDACRDNPFSRSWSRSLVSGGLASINAPQGTFIGFATSPGAKAADGEGRNGVYTAALLEHLRKPNQTIDQLFNAVSGSVKKKTNSQQVPWKTSSLSEDLYLRN